MPHRCCGTQPYGRMKITQSKKTQEHYEGRERLWADARLSGSTTGRLTRASADELGANHAAQADTDYEWHFGRITSLGTIRITDSRTVTIL
jgi:hypothetical protein